MLHWADGGLTVITNMVLLCGTHHRLLHEGGFSIVLDAGGGVTVRDIRGRLVRAVPPTAGDLRQWTPPDVVTSDTLTPDWNGEPLDTSMATSVLLEHWALAKELGEAYGDGAHDHDLGEDDESWSGDAACSTDPQVAAGRLGDCESVKTHREDRS
ncbi:HNH endonuclease [Georgenia yuyongxinii]|uniref:HNH endonuclease n=1 Tax=Georgenia yuyongxinii TaxID=2589797 RepID=A0A552WQ16_9MICO|nr:HNH endonuclease [Georgenia yuyongxinii]